MKPEQLRSMATWLQDQFQASLHKVCSLIGLSRSVWYYTASRRDDRPIRMRIKEIAEARVRYGFWRIWILLKREGWNDNHKRIYRIYKEEGLNLRSKRPRRSKSGAHRLDRLELTEVRQCWSMDFVADQLFDGRKFRALTLVDNFSRYCLTIRIGQSIKGIDVSRIMDEVKLAYGITPQRIQVDNGSEFISKDFDRWAYENKVTLDYSRPGKPTDNPFIESFNGSFRDECLNTNWFLSFDDAAEKIEGWQKEYNHFRPHSSLDGKTPGEVFVASQKSPNFLI